jgi:hypothetical protein
MPSSRIVSALPRPTYPVPIPGMFPWLSFRFPVANLSRNPADGAKTGRSPPQADQTRPPAPA